MPDPGCGGGPGARETHPQVFFVGKTPGPFQFKAALSLVAKVRFCKPGSVVRFHQAAPTQEEIKMKIKIDPTIPDLTDEELAELREADIKDAEGNPEAKAGLLQCKEVVFSPQVIKQMEKMGITPDEVVAMLLKKVGASQ